MIRFYRMKCMYNMPSNHKCFWFINYIFEKWIFSFLDILLFIFVLIININNVRNIIYVMNMFTEKQKNTKKVIF